MQDSFGRSGGGNPDPKDFIKQLLSTTKPVMKKESNDSGINQLYEAVNTVALKIDQTANQDLSQAKQFVNNVSNLYKELKSQNKTSNEDSKESKDQTKLLKNASDSMSTFLKEAKKQNTLWIGVSKFGKRAENQLQGAIERALGKGSQAAKSGLGGSGKRSSRSGRVKVPGGGVRVPGAPGGSGGGGDGGVIISSVSPGGSGGGGGGNTGALSALSSKNASSWMAAGVALSTAAIQLGRVGESFMNALDLNFSSVFDGLIKDEDVFKRNMRQTVYQTEGLTGANRELESQYFEINKLVSQTGYDRSEFQKLWIDNMDRGYKIQSRAEGKEMKTAKGREKLRTRHVRDMKEITTSALHTSKQTGISAENLNGMFMNMQFGMSMTSNQVKMVATGMKSIARDMGLTGDSLGKAIANAEKLMQKMADAGTLTAEAAIGLNRAMAAATKHNVEGVVNRLQEATTGFNQWKDSGEETQRLLRLMVDQGGLNMQDIFSGKQMSTEFGQREFYSTLGNTIQSAFSNISGDLSHIDPNIQKSVDEGKFSKAIQQLNEIGRTDIATKIQANFKPLTGIDIGEAERLSKMIEDRNMSHLERMSRMREEFEKAELDGSISAQRELSARMAGARADMVSQIGRTMLDLRDEGMGLADASEAMIKRMSGHFMEEGMNQAQAIEAARKQIPELFKGDAIKKGMQTRVEEINRQGGSVNLNKLFKQHGPNLGYNSIEQLQNGMEKGEKDAMSAFDAINQTLSDEERALSDPMTAMSKYLKEINETLRGWSQGILSSIGMNTLLLVGIASKMLYSLGIFGSIFYGLRGLGKLIGVSGGGKGGLFSLMGKELKNLFPKLGSLFSINAARTFGLLFARIFAPLQLLTGAFTGISNREEHGRGIGEAGVLGALTGGSGTGSMFSGMLGVEKGSTGDKALGVAGATAWGAAAGAAIGSIIPGIGTAIGALIGGILGASTELIKIFTEGTTFLNDLLFGWIDIWWKGYKNILQSFGEVIMGIFTLDGDRIVKGLEGIFWSAVNTLEELMIWLFKSTITMFTELPGMFFLAIKAVLLDFPKWFFDKYKSVLDSLSSHEIFGPIFEPIKDVFYDFHDIFMSIYNALEPVLKELGEAFLEIKSIIFELLEPLLGTTDGFSFLGDFLKSTFLPFIKFVAHTIGFAIKLTLLPLKMFLQTVKFVVFIVGKIVTGIVSAFQWLYDVLYGHSIVPDLVEGIVKFFATLPIKIMSALLGLGGQITKYIWDTITNIPSMLLKSFDGLGSLLYGIVKNGVVNTAKKGAEIAGNVAKGAAFGPSGFGVSMGMKAGKALFGKNKKGTADNANLGAFTNETVDEAMDKGLEEVNNSLDNKSPKESTNSLMDIMKSINENVYHAACGIYEILSLMNNGNVVVSSNMLGAFSNSESTEANAFGTNSIVNGLASTTNLGAFEKFQSQNDLMTEKNISDRLLNQHGLPGVNEIFDSVREYFDDATGGSDTSLSKAMYYDIEGTKGGGVSYAEWLNAEGGSGINPNMMDYTDSIKGQINPRMMNDQQLESAIQSRLMTTQNSMTNAAEGTEKEDTELFKLMVRFLETIAQNTTPEQFSEIIGKTRFGVPPVRGSGIKRTASDLMSSYWDIQHGDNSPANVNNDGRGSK